MVMGGRRHRGNGDEVLGITAGMGTGVCGNTMGTCSYNHLKMKLVLFSWTYCHGQTNTAVRRLRWCTSVPWRTL